MARLSLDYSTQEISPPFEPMPDDLRVVNDVTVTRRDGSSGHVVQDTGPLSTQDPPDGVGVYDTQLTVDAYRDEQCEHIASWIGVLGTQDVERYPRVRLDLGRNPSRIADAMAVDTQDRMTLSNLPSWMPPGDAELLVEGYTESISQYSWDLVFNTTPGGVYQAIGRWPLLSHELHAAIDSSTTSIDIANTDVDQPMLATDAAEIGSGYRITVVNEDMQLTAVAESLITFGAAGTASHQVNADTTPGIPASVATGDLLIAVCAMRNSGTGVPSTIAAGYSRLPVFPATSNVQVYAKIATSGAETPPVFGLSGSAAGVDVTAQMIRLPGRWHDVDNLLIGSACCLNASAQNITVPGLSLPTADNAIVIGIGWKQDDWTSVDTRSGFTEIGEPDTTTGDDQGLVWDYQIQNTATAVAPTPFVVNGGASAISRGAVFALRCDYQTATVTRSVNGVTAAHSAGDAVTMTDPMRWGLV